MERCVVRCASLMTGRAFRALAAFVSGINASIAAA
jgi:hypothetical protein